MPTESAVLLIGESIIAVLFIVAVVLAALHKGTYHHYLVLSGFLLDELIFKPLMYQRLSVGVLGSFPYEATSGLPHIVASSIATVLGIVTIYLGFKYRTKKGWRMFLPPKGRIHKYIGASYLIAWAVTMVVGLRIFASFYL